MIEFKTIDDRVFVYDPNLMSMDQALACESHFRIWEKTFKVLPATPDEVQLASNMASLKNGYACLLVERLPDGSYKPFDATFGANIDLLKYIKGADARKRLEECKEDFFQLCGIATTSSTESLQNLMTVVKEMPKEEQSLIFQMVLENVGGQRGRI